MSDEQFKIFIEKIDLLISHVSKTAGDRVGGLELAVEVTGYKEATIYKKIKDKVRPMPHRKDGKLVFSEAELRAWLLNTTPEINVEKATKRKIGRSSLIDRAAYS